MAKSNTPAAIQRRKQQNARYPCSAPNCTKPRNGLSGWCGLHAQRVALYGWHGGTRLQRKVYNAEHVEASAFIEKYQAHSGIQNALRWLGDWLRDASAGVRVPAYAEFQRLNARGVSALDVLTESLAVWLYISRHVSNFPTNRAVDSAIGTCVLYVVPRARHEIWTNGTRTTTAEKISGGKRRETGELTRRGLGSLFLNIERQIIADHEAQVRRMQSMTLPFTNTNP